MSEASSTLAPVHTDARSPRPHRRPNTTVNVRRVIEDRVVQKSLYRHLFHQFTVYAGPEVFPARAMIDSETVWNLIAQDVVKQHGLPGDDNLPNGRKSLGGFPIQPYQCHNLILKSKDKNGQPSMAAISVIGADFTGCDVILGIPWLQTVKPTIKWEDGESDFPKPDFPALPTRGKRKKERKRNVSAHNKSSSTKNC